MPRNNRRKGKTRNRKRKSRTDQLLVPFVFTKTYSFANSATGQVLAIDNALTSRLSGLSQYYAFYRVVRLRIIISPYADTTTNNNYIAVSYNPDTTGTATTPTFAECTQWLASVVVPSMKTTSTTLSVPRSILLNDQNRMFSVGTGDNLSVTQGVVHIKPNANATTTLLIKVVGMYKLITSTPSSSSLKIQWIPHKELPNTKVKLSDEIVPSYPDVYDTDPDYLKIDTRTENMLVTREESALVLSLRKAHSGLGCSESG